MSRGLGRIERTVLLVLNRNGPDWISVEWLAKTGAVQHLGDEWDRNEALRKLPEPTRAAVESFRRAVKALAKKGLVELAHKYSTTKCHRRTPRGQRVYADDTYSTWEERRYLVCRRLLTADECLAEEQARAEHERKKREAISRLLALRGGAGTP